MPSTSEPETPVAKLLAQIDQIAWAMRNIDSAQGRYVLDVLLARGPMTVPSIARQLSTSRQNVQISANRLAHNYLVTWETNESHKRSKLLTLTEQGRAEAARIAEAENSALRALGTAATDEELEACSQVLSKLLQHFPDARPTIPKSPTRTPTPRRKKAAPPEQPKPSLPTAEEEPLPVNLL